MIARVRAGKPSGAKNDDWVFANADGQLPNPRTPNLVLTRIAEQEGLPHIRFHDIRRTFGSMLLAQGHQPRVIQHLYGHATMGLTMEVYREAMEKDVDKARLPVPDAIV